MKRVLITGASGFVGSNLLSTLLDEGIDTHLALRKESKLWRLDSVKSALNETRVYIPLSNTREWAEYIRDNRIDTVVHLATFGSYPNQIDKRLTISTNLFDSLSLLNACVESKVVRRFISAGSGSEYAVTNSYSFESSSLYSPNIYGRTKASFGLIGELLCEDTQVNFVHFRLFSIYGPFEEPSRIVPRLLTYGALKKFPPLSKPNVARDFTYVDDVIDILMVAMKEKSKINGVFNVCASKSTKLEEIVRIVAEIYQIPHEPIWGKFQVRKFDSEDWTGSNSSAAESFGWSPKVDLELGLRKFRNWIQTSQLKEYYTATE